MCPHKDYKKEVKLTLIIEHAKSAGEATYRLEQVMDSIMERFHGYDEETETSVGAVAFCDDENSQLMIDVSEPKEGEDSCPREWVICEPGKDHILKPNAKELTAN